MASGNPFLEMGGFGGFDASQRDDSAALSNPFMDDAPGPGAALDNNPFGAFLASSEPTPAPVADVALSNPFADSVPPPRPQPPVPRPPPPKVSVAATAPPPVPPPPHTDLLDGPAAPPPRPPVPEATRNLLASVTGHLEAASDSLFGQLSNVKTPRQSPTHMLSRSPSPPLDGLDEHVEHHDVAFSAAFGQTVEELSDHEDAPDHAHAPTDSAAHEIDLWDSAPAAPVTKTKDQILSLFNTPATRKPEQEVDLLSSSFHDEAAHPTGDLLADGPPMPPAKDGADMLEQPVLTAAPASVPAVPEPTIWDTPELPKAATEEEDKDGTTQAAPEEGKETEDGTADSAEGLQPPAPPPHQSSPSEEVPLRPLELQLDAPPDAKVVVDAPEEDGRAHTAAAFMDEFSTPVVPVSQITPPSPLSPPGPSPIPSVVTTPTLAEGPPPGQYEPSQPPTALTPPEELTAPPQPTSEPEVATQPARPPPPPRPAAPPARPPPPGVTAAAPAASPKPTVDPLNIFSAPSEPSSIFGGGIEPPEIPSAPVPSPLGIFDTPPATAAAASSTTQAVDPLDIFSAPAASEPAAVRRPPPPAPPRRQPPPSPNPFLETVEAGDVADAAAPQEDAFDAFAARFEKAADDAATGGAVDPFGAATGTADKTASVWGDSAAPSSAGPGGFEDPAFDSFLSMTAPPPVPQSTPARGASKQHSEDEPTDLNVFIRPQQSWTSQAPVPALAPPPKPAVAAFQDAPADTLGSNPFAVPAADLSLDLPQAKVERPEPESGSPPETPLFDEDTSQPLEPFPRTTWDKAEFDMYLRQPNKKKITGQRFWKKVFVRLADNAVLQLFNDRNDSDPFQELPLQACYSVSDVGAQQYDQYGKIFTVKLQYIFYKERPGVRPGQMTKAERITKKLGQFAISAWEGDYDRVKEFASDVRKLGMPVEHAPQISQLLKLGTQHYEDVKRFASFVEETLFKVNVHRDRALNYKTEEIQISGVDEVYLEQDVTGAVTKQLARVRLFFLAFLSGMPDVELGINDLRRQGKEVVGRHDIIPVATEEWIRLEDVQFHNIIDLQAFKESQILKFKPPDGCYIELMRFRVRPPRSRELPLQVKVKYTILQNKVDISADILVPGYVSRKMGQIPCEDVCVRMPLPECWIYMFRVEKHFRYGSVKASHRRQGKVKGIERILGAVDTLEQSLMEVSSGSAKYEHHHRAIAWRIPRLPKEGQGAYTNHTFSCKLNLTSFDQIPETFDRFCFVEYTMPHTTVSHTVCRSASISGGSGDPPEKYVRYLARYEYKVEMEFCYSKDEPAAYLSATQSNASKPAAEPPPPRPPSSDSDSDSD
ncbi:protein stoned-B-like [Amphibalanus amphitrite]|uniref:protein stoned-B-like n=1 Tax=Amphibalanus amphitrite TaxID=1232801 RepID=UPI001C8FC2FC|nr:protein stoned-B-like [Amphibalanus amphitrite]